MEKTYKKLWICQYGTRHEMSQNCECSKRFGWIFDFLDWVQRIYRIDFAHQITPVMQNEFLRVNSLTK